MKGLAASILVVAIFSFFFYQLRKNWHLLTLIKWDAHPFFLVCHVFLMILMFIVFVWGWKYSLAIHGFNVNWRDAAHSWLLANIGKYFPGKVFMVAGRIELSRKAGVRRIASFSAFVIENALMVFAALPFLALALLQGVDLPQYQLYFYGVLFILIGCCVCVNPKIINQGLNAVCRRLGKESITIEIKTRNMLTLIAGYFSGWLCYGFGGMLLSYALGVPQSVSWITLVVAFIASWVVGYISLLTPGGLGVREIVLVGLLTPEIQPAHAMALALIARLSWTLIELMGSVVGVALKNAR